VLLALTAATAVTFHGFRSDRTYSSWSSALGGT
jgi:hypothetical protein